ncbi:MAG TPA: tetratricopeptide repeat protein [Pyrinomonadaceae bacterium]
MSKRTVGSSLLAAILLLVLVQHYSVTSARYFDRSTVSIESVTADDSASTDPETAATDSTTDTKKKGGNGFVRALSAPFRAIGRLFGGGGKKTDQQARRSSNKDASKFEGAVVTRIKDGRVQPPAPAETASAEQPSSFSPLSLHLMKGRAAINLGDFDSAIAELSRAASLDAKNAEVQNLLGIAFEGKGMRQRALASFENAVHLNKNNAQYLNNYGFLLYRNGDLEEATKYLKRATKLVPNDARIWNNLGLTQCAREKFDDAYMSFVRAVGEYNGHINIAAQLQQHGYAKNAITHLEKAQAMRPNSADVLSKLVSLYEMTGRHTDAETARRSLVALKTFADANK